MICDLVLCGVGGQGVLSIARLIDHAAAAAGFHLKQSEVHGMAQRGGAVSAFVRIADEPVASDLVAEGSADMILSLEPLESLRYARLLKPEGWIVTDVAPLVNMAGYPDQDALFDVLFSAPRVLALDAVRIAHEAGTVKAHNVVMLGAAAARLPVHRDALVERLRALFAGKGQRVVDANVAAFRMGESASRFSEALVDAGVPMAVAARAVASLGFRAEGVPREALVEWIERLRAPGGRDAARRMFADRATERLEV